MTGRGPWSASGVAAAGSSRSVASGPGRCRLLAAVLVLALLAAACGSGAQDSGGTWPGLPGGEGDVAFDEDPAAASSDGAEAPGPSAIDNGAETPAGIDDPDGSAPLAPAAPAGSVGASAGAAAAQAPGAAPQTAGGAAPPAEGQASRPPLCSGTVQLGIKYYDPDDTNAAGAAVGAADTNPQGEGRLLHMLTRLNEAGGLAGCQVEPVWYPFRPTGNWVRQSEESCARFTQDNDVFAVMNLVNIAGRTLMDCLTRAGVIQYWPRTVTFMMTDEDYRRNAGSMYRPDDIGIDRKGFLVDHLREAGYFDPGARVALVWMEDGTNAPKHLVDNIIKPRLAQHGINLVAEGGFRQVRSLAEVNRMAQDASQLVLRFRTNNVSHVFFTGGGGSFMFTNVAESQGYNPRYALTSDEDLGALDSHPTEQHIDSVTISWQPIYDAMRSRALWPENPAIDRCIQNYGYQDDPDASIDMAFCDGLEFLKAGLARAPEMSQAGFRTGVEQLGTSYVSAVGFGPTRLGPGRYDGGVSARAMTFDPEIHSFRYTGPARPVP